MALFSNNENDNLKIKIYKMQNENKGLKEQLLEYEKVFGNFEDMKKVTDRVREENKRLLEKLEENIEIKAKMQKIIDELKEAVNAKKEEFQYKLTSMESKDDNIVVGNNAEFYGGLSTPKSISTGNNVIVHGNLRSSEKISLGDKNQIKGTISCKKGISTGKECILEKDISTKGGVNIGEKCILQNINSKLDVYVGKGSAVKKIITEGNVFLKDNVKIEDGIEYKESINIGKDVSISGEIKTIKK